MPTCRHHFDLLHATNNCTDRVRFQQAITSCLYAQQATIFLSDDVSGERKSQFEC